MKTGLLWGLIGLNVLLLGIFVARYMQPSTARAQGMRPSDYIAVPGHIASSPDGVVYLLDTEKGFLSAMIYDAPNRTLVGFASIDLDALFAKGMSAVGPAGRAPTPPRR